MCKMAGIIFELNIVTSLFICLALAVAYVASLYVWNSNLHRDHPTTIKRRFVSVMVNVIVAPIFLWCFSTHTDYPDAHSLPAWLGMKFSGLITASVLPLILTMILFLGPLALYYMDGVLNLYLDPKYWQSNVKNLIWLRTHVVAPFSEEFIFRACMVPVLLPAIGAESTVVFAPVFFGVAHFHHMLEKIRLKQQDVKTAFLTCFFQFCFTSVFGAYSAFLFIRTGHLAAPVIAHAFCNHMGFPDFGMVFAYKNPVRTRLIACFIIGLVSWLFLLYPLTHPPLFSNRVYNLEI